MKLLLSTGCFFERTPNVNESVLEALEYDVVGVELTLLSVDECLGYEPSEEVINRLGDKIVTLHAPAKNIDYCNNKRVNRVVSKLKELYDLLNCENITFHLSEGTSLNYLLGEFEDYTISVENPAVNDDTLELFTETLEKYPNIPVTLDVCHAMEYGKSVLKKLSEYERINEVHWSYTHEYRHDSAVLNRDENVDYMLRVVKELNTPVVIEVDLRNRSGRNILGREVRMLRES